MSRSAGAIPALTGLRGFAALWVFASHISYTDALLYPLGIRTHWQRCAGVIMHEYLAVDVFFMLSGFVLSHVHRHEFQGGVRRPELGRFLLLRLARVYPLHLVALALAYVALRAVPDPLGINTRQTLGLQLGLMASWGIVPGLSWNLPAWSLSSEWLAYLLFPLILLGASGAQTTRARLLAIAGLCFLFWLMIFGQPRRLDYMSGPGAHTRVLIGMGIGVLLRGLYDDPRVRGRPWHLVLYAALPITAATMSEWSGARRPDNIWAYLMMVVILFAASCGQGKWMAPLTVRPVRYLGDISYAIYIFHYPVLRALRALFGPQLLALAYQGSDAQVWIVLAGALGVVLAVSALAHHTLEDPFRRWAKRRIGALDVAPKATS